MILNQLCNMIYVLESWVLKSFPNLHFPTPLLPWRSELTSDDIARLSAELENSAAQSSCDRCLSFGRESILFHILVRSIAVGQLLQPHVPFQRRYPNLLHLASSTAGIALCSYRLVSLDKLELKDQVNLNKSLYEFS